MDIDYDKKFKRLKFWFYTKTVYNFIIYEMGVLFVTLVLLLKSYQKFSWVVVFGCLLAYIFLLGISYLLYIVYNMYKSKNHLDHIPDTVQKSSIGKEIANFIKDNASNYTWANDMLSTICFSFGVGALLALIFTWGLEALKVVSIPTSLYIKLLILFLLCLIQGIATKVVTHLCKA